MISKVEKVMQASEHSQQVQPLEKNKTGILNRPSTVALDASRVAALGYAYGLYAMAKATMALPGKGCGKAVNAVASGTKNITGCVTAGLSYLAQRSCRRGLERSVQQRVKGLPELVRRPVVKVTSGVLNRVMPRRKPLSQGPSIVGFFERKLYETGEELFFRGTRRACYRAFVRGTQSCPQRIKNPVQHASREILALNIHENPVSGFIKDRLSDMVWEYAYHAAMEEFANTLTSINPFSQIKNTED